MRRDDIDFHIVPDNQLAIHAELENWSRWVRVRPHGWQVSPMFRMYRPELRTQGWWERREPRIDVDMPKAVEMEKAVSLLPAKHRDAIRWAYVHCGGPVRVAKALGVSKQGLADLIWQGRAMLSNRRSDR